MSQKLIFALFPVMVFSAYLLLFNPADRSDLAVFSAGIDCDENGGDWDGDGICADFDCDDSDPENTKVMPDCGTTCMSGMSGVDNDSDGYCNDVDCDDGDGSVWVDLELYRDADGDGYEDGEDPTTVCTNGTVPSGYLENSTEVDCDDTNSSVYPGADEYCNSVDDDCDGSIDEDAFDASTWYEDFDGDSYGNAAVSMLACVQPGGFVGDNTDCDDTSAGVYPGADEYCNDLDDDCDGSTDEDAIDVTTWYEDGDGDGYGNSGVSQSACDQPPGYITDNTDCDDTDYYINPGVTEICDGIDNNCDGSNDEGFGGDGDGDGVGQDCDNCPDEYNPPVACLTCLVPVGYQLDSDSDGWGDECDCDDANDQIHPGATEICDEVDNDCDGFIDEDLATTWYQDSDGDGYGNLNITEDSCAMPVGYVDNAADCNDSEPLAYDGAPEDCDDGIDNDCDGYTDCQDGDCNGTGNDAMATSMTFYADADGDGFGDLNNTKDSCVLPNGYVSDNTDCNDACMSCFPGNPEICDGLDNDCNGSLDDGLNTYFADVDGDGFYDPLVSKDTCAQPDGYIDLNGSPGIDCDDSNDQLTNNCPSITYYVDSSNTSGMALTGRFRSVLMVGESWDMAFTTLQAALAAAAAGDTIKVAQGTYYPGSTRDSSFIIPSGIVLLGGYPMGGGTDEERNLDCYKTILSGDIGTPGDNSDNSYHVMVTTNADSSTIVDGFCITGGNANGTFDDRYGGGWFNRGIDGDSSNPSIINCRIFGNNASRNGGGIGNFGDLGPTNPKIINTVISGNTAVRGAGIYNYGYGSNSSPVLINCILSGNRASYAGGGIYNDGEDGNSSPTLINCVLNGNYAGSFGSAAFNTGFDGDMTGNSDPFFTNCVIWNNDAGIAQNVFFNEDASLTVSYSVVQGADFDSITDPGYNPTGGSSNIFSDPVFINAPSGASAPTTAGDFHVLANSPCIDQGDNASNAFPTDLDGNDRIVNFTIDAGVYEFQRISCTGYGGIAYVKASALGLNNGSSWTNAFNDLQDALEIARTCGLDTILVAEGTYYPSCPDTIYDACTGAIQTILAPNRQQAFILPDGITLLGGYPAGGMGDRDPQCNLTILSGDIDMNGDSTGNTFNVVKTIGYQDTIVFDGFIIEQGNAIANGEEGGAWWDGSDSSTALLCIRDVIFRNNYALFGGAFYGEGHRDLKMVQSEFYENVASLRGGAIYFSPPFMGDTAVVRLENNLMHHDSAFQAMGFAGGAIALTFTNFISLSVVNNTIASNYPDAFNNNSGGLVRIWNSILWDNGPDPINGFVVPQIEYCIVQEPFIGTGNKFIDPLFIDPSGNYRLSPLSQAINMGENSYSLEMFDLNRRCGITMRYTFTTAYSGTIPTPSITKTVPRRLYTIRSWRMMVLLIQILLVGVLMEIKMKVQTLCLWTPRLMVFSQKEIITSLRIPWLSIWGMMDIIRRSSWTWITFPEYNWV